MLSDALTRPVVVIGDLVASRRAADRSALDRELARGLRVANDAYRPVEPLTPTVGDEVQGTFERLLDAIRATLLVRLSLTPPHDIRFGLGVGEVTHLGRWREMRRQDGPAWWAARDAIEFVAAAATRRTVPKTLRTWVGTATPEIRRGQHTFDFMVERADDPAVRAVNAYLVGRDHLVTRMAERDRRLLLGLLAGRSVSEIAEAECVTPSAISQRSQRSGAAAIAFAEGNLL